MRFDVTHTHTYDLHTRIQWVVVGGGEWVQGQKALLSGQSGGERTDFEKQFKSIQNHNFWSDFHSKVFLRTRQISHRFSKPGFPEKFSQKQILKAYRALGPP